MKVKYILKEKTKWENFWRKIYTVAVRINTV